MAYFLRFGDGILIGFGIIFISLVLCLVNGRSKGLPAVLTYTLIAFIFLAILLVWPIKGANELEIESSIKTDVIMIPRTILLCFFPFLLIYLAHLYVRYELLDVVRVRSTEGRHGQPWIVQTKIKNMNK
uniref:Uncharacterized protein n=1 Tax=Caenorhabditis japonica TaxID=281687 RepID=A0A8R1E8N8_CAEJA